jgi:polyhydroxyalkanoate synthesis regulator phasin
MSELVWTVHYRVTKRGIRDILELDGVVDNPAITLACAILDLPDGKRLLPALDKLLKLIDKADDWIDGECAGYQYECSEAIENLMKELDTYEHEGSVVHSHTELRMRLLLEEMNALFANYDMMPLRVMIDTLKQQLQDQPSSANTD